MDNQISPAPAQISDAPVTRLLNFYDALREVTKGRYITKVEWKNNAIYGFLDGVLQIHTETGRDDNWLISDGDLLGEDWMVL